MDEFYQISAWLGFLIAAAVAAYIAFRSGRRWLSMFIKFGMLGSAVGFMGALIASTLNWQLWRASEQQVSASLRETYRTWISVADHSGLLIGAVVGAILGVIVAYALRHKLVS
jgi:hypothetical protein